MCTITHTQESPTLRRRRVHELAVRPLQTVAPDRDYETKRNDVTGATVRRRTFTRFVSNAKSEYETHEIRVLYAEPHSPSDTYNQNAYVTKQRNNICHYPKLFKCLNNKPSNVHATH